MKKLLGILSILILAVFMVGCENPEDVSDAKIVVKFDTQGGEIIDDVELTLQTIGTFRLPADPVKEGYEFKGWYMDYSCETPYTALNVTEGTVILYAKWDQVLDDRGLDIEATFKLNLSASITMAFGDFVQPLVTDGVADLKLTAKIEQMQVADLSDLKGKISISLVLNEAIQMLLDDPFDGMSIDAYIKDGKLYMNLPAIVTGATADTLISLDMNTIMDKVSENVPEEVVGKDMEEIMENVMEELQPYLTAFAEMGLTSEKINEVVEILSGLLPSVTVDATDPNTTVYAMTEEQIMQALDKIVTFVKENKVLVTKIINYIKEASAEVESDPLENYYEDEDGNKFYYELPYYADSNNKIHQYSEDTECLYGELLDNGLYLPTYNTMFIFDKNSDWKAYSGQLNYMDGSSDEKIRCFILTDGTGYINLESQAVTTSPMTDLVDILSTITYEEYGMNYCFINGVYYDNAMLPYSSDVVIEKMADSLALKIEEIITMITEVLTINKLEATVTMNPEVNEPSNIKSVVDVVINMDFDDIYTIALALNTEIKVNGYEATIEFPDFTGYIDMTSTIFPPEVIPAL